MNEPSAELRNTTFRYDSLRAIAQGITETAATTFLLLIAVRVFSAGSFEKGLMAAGNNIGLLLTPLALSWVARSRMPVSKAAAILLLATGGLWLAAAAVGTLTLFLIAALAGSLLISASFPMITQMYQTNYAARERGMLYSRAGMLRTLAAIGAGELGGRLLNIGLEWWHALMVAFGTAMAFSAWCLNRIPTQPLAVATSRNPFAALRYLFTDRRFLLLQVSWFLLGFGTLMMVPLRVEYLANPRYGVNLDSQQIALYVVAIPSIMRLFATPIWGWVFDRFSFFVMRAALNCGFAIGIFAFFANGSPVALVFSAIAIGLAEAGGNLAWSLWATKYTTPDKVPDYMAAHTFLTGIRGGLAPFLAFQLTDTIPLNTLGIFASGLVLASAFLLIPEMLPKKTGVV